MKAIIGLVVILLVAVLGFSYVGTSDENDVDTRPADGESAPVYVTSGTLEDVTDGAIVRGVQTLETTTGFAEAGFTGETYTLSATFTDLPKPQGDDFYEGWVVRRGSDFSVISTGELTNEGDGTYTNVFTSDDDLLDHDFYVLTLEPNDGDPAPADHILEGELLRN